MATAAPDPDLMCAIGFTAADLEANRQGKLTEFQRRIVINRRSQVMKVFDFVTFLMIGVTIVGFYAFIYAGVIKEYFWVLPGFIIVIMVWVAASLFVGKEYSADLKAMKVESRWGKILLEQRLAGSVMLYFLKIEDFEIRIDHEVFLHFKHHEPYTLYYTPNTKVLVAAEPLIQEPTN